MNTLKKNKHLTLDDRLKIQIMLNEGNTFKDIAEAIEKDPSTISKEVRKHITVSDSKIVTRNLEGNILKDPCEKLLKPPYVCNSCNKKRRCTKATQTYNYQNAHSQYLQTLTDSREGIVLKKESFYEMDNIITEGVKKGQHLYHILKANNLDVSISSIYRYQSKGYLSIKAIDLPRKVKFKPRAKGYREYVPSGVKKNRTYDDFLEYIKKNNITNWIEMDTVIGRIGGKVLLTLNFNLCNFMMAFLLNSKSAKDVTNCFKELRILFKNSSLELNKLMPVILTDNGGEFSNVSGIENNLNSKKDIRLFFCRPMRSSDKPHVEKNHTLFRDICKKGSSFDHFTQEDINLIFSHINSVKRKSLNGKSPYDIFEFTYGKKITSLLGIKKMPEREVIQSSNLLKELR